jgi:transcriptional regulator with XRE-family HTH domain
MTLVSSPLLTIRAKKLGIRLRAAREARGLSPESCAAWLGCPVERYLGFEEGQDAPSLPDLEVLADRFDLPLRALLDDRQGLGLVTQGDGFPTRSFLAIRQRWIGVTLRRAREKAGMDAAEMARALSCSPEELESLELGQVPVPFPLLDQWARRLRLTLEDLEDQSGPVAARRRRETLARGFFDLPPELQEFVANGVNRSYLEIAQRLSQLPADRLRTIAEGLLDITL